MALIAVSSITKETENKTVTVKVLRLWYPTDQQKKPVSIEAILMDSEVWNLLEMFSFFTLPNSVLTWVRFQGSKIPAYVKRGLILNFKKLLTEGETIKISNFGVDENGQSKWSKARVECPVKLLFNYMTKVNKCKPDICIPSYGLSLTPFDDIEKFNDQFYIGLCLYMDCYIVVLF